MSLQDLVLNVSAKGNVVQQPTEALSLSGVFNVASGLGYKPGAGAGQVDKLYHGLHTITASGQLDLDLAGGTLEDVDGEALTLARVKGLIVISDPANAHPIIVGNHDTAAWVGPFGAAAHTVQVQPGGQLSFWTPSATGWAVTPDTADQLRLANGGADDVVCEVVIVGAAS